MNISPTRLRGSVPPSSFLKSSASVLSDGALCKLSLSLPPAGALGCPELPRLARVLCQECGTAMLPGTVPRTPTGPLPHPLSALCGGNSEQENQTLSPTVTCACAGVGKPLPGAGCCIASRGRLRPPWALWRCWGVRWWWSLRSSGRGAGLAGLPSRLDGQWPQKKGTWTSCSQKQERLGGCY